MKDEVFSLKLDELQRFLQNLSLFLDTQQKEKLLKCLKIAYNSIKKDTPVNFKEKEKNEKHLIFWKEYGKVYL